MGEPPSTPPEISGGTGERRKAFDALAEVSADGIVMVDDDSIVRYANPAVERILGYEPEDLHDEPLVTIVPDRLQRAHTEAFQRYLDTGEKQLEWTYVELPGRHAAGHEVPLAISFNEFTHEGDRYFVGTFRDISQRKEIERELERSRRQLRTLIRILPVGVIVADEDGSLVEANDTAKRIWGGFADADSVAEYERYSGWWVDSGEPVAPEEWPLARALRGEEVTDPDLIEIEGFDGERRVVLLHAMPIRDDRGDVERAVVTMVDVTDREERKRQLRRQNERLDQFASMLAHELRNPLEIAQVYLDFLGDEEAETVDQISEALDRMDEIIEMLLALARVHSGVDGREAVDLTRVAEDAWADTRTRDATLEIADSETLRANPTHLQQLLENLFRNSVEHGDEATTVRVGALEDGFYVEDTGPGIPEDEREAAVEPGYTTDSEGIGLGLTFVTQLADTYGWEYAITESDEGGARFEFANVEIVDGDCRTDRH